MYIRHLFKNLRIYIKHYLKCELNQIKRYKSYKNIIFINRFEISFHIIVINFIVILFIIIDDLNYLFTIINKFFKRVLFILEKIIYFVIE